MRTLVDIQIGPYPMSRAMQEIQSGVPQVAAGNGIELGAAGSIGEAQQLQLDMTFQYECIDAALLVGDRAEGNGTGNVGGAVRVLCTTVEQQQSFGTQRGIGIGCRLIMNDGTMGLVSRNGIK